MPDLLQRRQSDLLQQFEVLPAELEYWKGLAKSGGAYEKHYSQIKALSTQMLDLNEKVKATWKASPHDPYIAVRSAQDQCAAVHSIWNFFREKLVLRQDPRFGEYLKAADAYAWACYQPMVKDRQAKPGDRTWREPPLVAFNSDVSPWALSRQSRYDDELSESGRKSEGMFQQVWAALPIPIIGIPWQSDGLLPGMAAVAHETGHIADFDFKMKAAIAPSVAKAMKNSALAPAWSDHWWKEVFADLFACWFAGPSFVWALADVVPESPSTVKTKKRPSGPPTNWGSYPPGTLRMLLNLAALRQIGFSSDADAIYNYWTADYPSHAMTEFENDAAMVAQTVYASGELPEDVRYDKLNTAQWQAFNYVFDNDVEIPRDEVIDARALVGAASKASREVNDSQKLARGFKRLAQFMSKRPPGQLDAQLLEPTPQPLKTQELFDLMVQLLPEE